MKKIYNYSIVVLASISIILVILDFSNIINVTHQPFYFIDNSILIIFTIDYIIRLFKSENRINFFKSNIFDLLAIIPFDSIFSVFRVARIFRLAKIARLARLTRVIALLGRITKNIKSFLDTNGFLKVIYISLTLIIISSLTYSYAENVSYIDAVWWALVTATTVGYGDISPTTGLGKIAAILLMFLGIGFIGMLTSTITDFINKDKIEENKKIDLLVKKIEDLEKKIDQLIK
ncbi:ion transporter [Carnobacterium maltaromaticum]|uniref:ion transporter n=1 Tax=Carnobacterium maltaromaticum TaxID=2751 RepID=UPI003B97FD68